MATSSSSTSSSSSSSGCCINPYCNGVACANVSSWTLNGLDSGNTDNCNLYVSFDVLPVNIQQIEIYKDSGRALADLVAIGQAAGAGTVTLSERNSSGVSGSVVWNGTLVLYPASCTLSCFIFSSSSTSESSDSLDTSSSSSTYVVYNSSSSSGCCINWTCEGTDCNHFSSWVINNTGKDNTDNCGLYVAFEFISPLSQEVRIYKDSSYASSALVAAGQGVAGTITLTQRNSSGLTGSVDWDGTQVDFPSYANLDCEFSSSSSRSSSSFSSSSSSSSYSTSSSSSSSHSSQSRSSASTFSSSSSSSIDSSTSSSESIGNTSTSSSSTFGGWNKTKPLILGMSAINSATVLNRLAQTISLVDTTYTIGKAYCYLYPNGNNDYTIHLEVYTCDDLGKPETMLASQTLAGTSVTQNGWYSFSFSLSGTTPSNKYMSFVLWQENGNEDDYVFWGYNFSDMLGTKAWISDDAATWVQHEGVVRALKIVGNFSAFDLTNHRILTPATTITTSVGDFDGGTYDGTKLVRAAYQYGSDRVEIDYSPLLSSFVVDSSGSMGWNDRFGTRKKFVDETIQRIKDHYPTSVLFDVVKFGALVANTGSIISGLGSAVTINLDLNNPTRTAYRFVVSGATASRGDVYSSNGNSYTVSQDIDAEDILICSADLIPEPYGSGILTRVSGSGDASISYDSYTISSISDPIVAYGFKNLENGHTYNISAIDLGGDFTSEVSLLNWQTLTSNPITLSVGENGPNGADSLDFTAADWMTLRKPLSLQNLSTTQLTSDAQIGSNFVSVSTTSFTTAGQYVDVFDKDIASLGMLVSNTVSTTLTFSNNLLYNVYKWSTNSGTVQISNLFKPVDVNITTAKLLVKDVSATRSITFYMQTINGLSIEWDFQPFEEWIIYNLFWNDETALLPITVVDVAGNPFPDGTKIAMYVGGYPDDSTENQTPATLLTEDASVGSFRLDLDSTTGYVSGQEIDVVNNDGEVQAVEIDSVGSDYVLLVDLLLYDFNVVDGARIIPHITEAEQTDAMSQTTYNINLLSASLGLVDATPIYVGKSLDVSLLKDYDPTPISPLSSYTDLLLDDERIRSYISDVPTIDGKILIQVLPITEDNLKTKKEKDSELDKIIRPPVPVTYSDQSEQNEMDQIDIDESLINAALSVTTTTTTVTIVSKDYDIESPVYLAGGSAQSSMTTYASGYNHIEFEGINVPGVDSNSASFILAKTYSIYPAIIVENKENGTMLAKQYLSPFNISFTPSVWIFSNCSVDQIPITMEYWSDAEEGCDSASGQYKTSTEYLRGVYAGNDSPITINYTVTYQGELTNNMTLTAKIYCNTNPDSETLACNTSGRPPPTNQYFNSILPKSTRINGSTTEEYQPLTTIEQWRAVVESNPASQIIQGTDEDQDVSSKEYGETIIAKYKDYIINNLGMSYVSGEEFDSDTPSVLDGSQFYVNPWEWTKATQYGEYQEQTVNVVNGKATITIPASDIVSTLFVEASVKFGDNDTYETIRADHVAISNPINIGAISPYTIEAQGGSTKYELGTNIKWYDATTASTISNVSVSFAPESTTCLPSVAKTDSEGYATGIRIGPHAPVTMHCPDAGSEEEALGCRCYGDYEAITITVSKMAYSKSVVRHIEWTAPLTDKESPTDQDSQFYFICTTSGSAWADATDNSGSTTVTSDMGWIENDLWVNTQYPDDGTLRIGCGNDQTEETPTPLSPTRVWPFRCDLKFVLDNPRWLPTSCGSILSLSSTFTAKVYGINRSIGNIKAVSDEDEYNENKPWKWKINVGTYYHYTDADGSRKARIGTGCTEPGPFDNGSKTVIPYPFASIVEPLGIQVTTEAYDGELVRNGIDSPTVVAEVTWKGQPITNWFTTSDGTVIEYQFPQVAFQSGTCSANNFTPATVSSPAVAIDHRGTVNDCLTVASDPDITLTSYSVTASLSRTSINQQTDGSSTHTHSCTVDKNGNGNTTQTIVLTGSYEDHTHTITNYVALSGGTVEPHTHTLRCVATTNLNPITNSRADVVINAYAYYDPTHCEPYSSSTVVVDDPYSDGSMGNRMMFGTIRFYSTYKGKKLLLSVDAPLEGWTSNNVTDETKTLDIEVSASWSEYSMEDSPGHWTIVPAQSVTDGTRIAFEINAYKPTPEVETNNITVSRPDSVKEYMYIKVTASAKVDGYEASSSKVITIRSSLQWIPGVSGLFFEPTEDALYISDAIDQITTIGASQIHDAIRYAAQRIIDFQTSQTDWKTAKKVIFLLTDGDENSSQYSISQAINNVNFIDGECEVPVIPIRLGYSYESDEVLTAKYALDTCGESWYMINSTDAEILTSIDDIVTGDSMSMNNGTYTNTIDLGSSNLPHSVYFRNFVIPVGSRITYRVRTSTDNTTWLDWSEWYDSSNDINYTETLSVIGRYFQYQVKLYGNENFETPYITAGATIDYYEAQTLSVFFQPVELDIDTDQYVASIHITHTGSIPETSTINYGFAQFNTTDINDYSSTTRPSITPDRHTILLTRYNETFLTDDHQTYTAINGGWPDSATAEVYRVNNSNVLGELIDASNYAINNKDGKVTFYNIRSSDDTFVLCVYFDSVFRIIMNAVNYGSESAFIDHIGIMYNVTKRIPKDSSGNIIHMPLNMRL